MPGFNPFRYRFPYTNLNDINLDWIIKQVKQISAVLQGKQDKPDLPGVSGQVLGLDENLDPVWLDNGGGGGGTTNYNSLSNKPQINSVTLSGNKTAADLGLANASDIPTVPVQSVNGQTGAVELDAADVGALPANTFIPDFSLQLPLMDGEASAGTTYARYSMEGHVHPTDTSRASNSDIGLVQNTDTATQNISKGQYVIWKGALYIASAAIASGATLSSSNLTEVTDGGLNDLAYFKPGQRYTIGFFGCAFVTDGGTSLTINITTGKNLLRNPTVESFKFAARGISGYIDIFNSVQVEAVGNPDFTISLSSGPGFFAVKLLKNSALSNTMNNTPATGNGTITILA